MRVVLVVVLEPAADLFQPLYLPGTIFVLVAAIAIWLHRMKASEVKEAWRDAAHKLAGPSLALLFAVGMVRVFIDSGENAADLESMPLVVAEAAARLAGAAPVSPDSQAVFFEALMNSRGERILSPECGWFSL